MDDFFRKSIDWDTLLRSLDKVGFAICLPLVIFASPRNSLIDRLESAGLIGFILQRNKLFRFPEDDIPSFFGAVFVSKDIGKFIYPAGLGR